MKFPGLDERSVEERLKRYWRSRWPRQPERSPMARWRKTWTRRAEPEENCLAVFLVEADFKASSPLSSARRMFPSSSFSASPCCKYSSTVFQPNSDLSGNKINFCLFVSSNVPSDRESLAFSTASFFNVCLRFVQGILQLCVEFVLNLVSLALK